jgi:pantoate--beta-alanine ligase
MAGSKPDIVRDLPALRDAIAGWRRDNRSIGLVPTMGALHDGHLSLVRCAAQECDRVLATIFVNPSQFAPGEDLENYPRDEAGDIDKLAALGTALIYAPGIAAMYGEGFATEVRVAGLTDKMCGLSRPHFFGGVATVVAKLLLRTMPDRAYFGEKDYQQLLVIRRMAADLDIPAEIVGCPVVRAEDGLALSSRNAYLTASERAIAPALFETIAAAAERTADGAACAETVRWAANELAARGFTEVDYVDIRDAASLEAVESWRPGDPPARVFAAAFLGKTRLIDNVPVAPFE